MARPSLPTGLNSRPDTLHENLLVIIGIAVVVGRPLLLLLLISLLPLPMLILALPTLVLVREITQSTTAVTIMLNGQRLTARGVVIPVIIIIIIIIAPTHDLNDLIVAVRMMPSRANGRDIPFQQPLLAAVVVDPLQIRRRAVQLVGVIHVLPMFEITLTDRGVVPARLRFVAP